MKLRTMSLVGGVLCVLLVLGVAVAEGALDLSWSLIGGSGQQVSGDDLVLESSIGQSAGAVVQGGGLLLQSGFMSGLAEPSPTPTITPGGPTLTPTSTPTITPTPRPPQYLPLIFKGG